MYQALFISALVLTVGYSLLIILYRRWFLELPEFQIKNDLKPVTRFSIMIPARNEADNIDRFLLSILEQQYPAELFEVILINDHSTDNTSEKVQLLQKEYSRLQLIELSEHIDSNKTNAYKKKAIEIAIAAAKGDWIITTDADCQANPDWLLQYDAFIQQENPVFVAAPVMFLMKGVFYPFFRYSIS